MLAATAVSQSRTDPLSGLVVGDVPVPGIPEGWTRVRVAASSLNMHDLWTLRGVGHPADQLPRILGCDAVGYDESGRPVLVYPVIADPARGGGDETLDPQRALLSERHDGAFAEYLVVPTRNLIPLPDGALPVGVVGHVQLDESVAVAERGGDGSARLLLDVGHDDLGTRGGQSLGHALTEALGPAGDQCLAAVEFEHAHACLLPASSEASPGPALSRPEVMVDGRRPSLRRGDVPDPDPAPASTVTCPWTHVKKKFDECPRYPRPTAQSPLIRLCWPGQVLRP